MISDLDDIKQWHLSNLGWVPFCSVSELLGVPQVQLFTITHTSSSILKMALAPPLMLMVVRSCSVLGLMTYTPVPIATTKSLPSASTISPGSAASVPLIGDDVICSVVV